MVLSENILKINPDHTQWRINEGYKAASYLSKDNLFSVDAEMDKELDDVFLMNYTRITRELAICTNHGGIFYGNSRGNSRGYLGFPV